jgi:multiple sugar transport system ATP-binding protein
MKLGVVQQVGKPQEVYDNPTNLFVAKFLGTPPINVFEGEVKGGKLYLDDVAVLDTPGVDDCAVYVGIRPEGFVPSEKGAFVSKLSSVEVMGRDVSIVSDHPASLNPVVRSIVDADYKIDREAENVKFELKPHKVFLFDKETEERINFEVK